VLGSGLIAMPTTLRTTTDNPDDNPRTLWREPPNGALCTRTGQAPSERVTT